MPDNLFCLDLGETQIKIASVKHKGSVLEALHMALEEADPVFFRGEADEIIEKEAFILSKLLKQLKPPQKTLNVVIPDSYSYNQFLEMPKLNEKELLSAIKYQADQFIPMPLDEVNIDIEIVFDDVRNKKILALISAAPKKIVEKVERLVESVGYFPESIETETSSVARFVSETLGKKEVKSAPTKEGLLFVNLGFSTTSLYFYDKLLNLVIFSYNFPMGLNLFLREIQVNLNVDQKKSEELISSVGLSKNTSYDLQTVLLPSLKNLTSEIEKSITELTTKNNVQIGGIYLFNQALRFQGLDELLTKHFGTTSSIFNISSYFVKNNVVDFFKDRLGYFVSTIGGALR